MDTDKGTTRSGGMSFGTRVRVGLLVVGALIVLVLFILNRQFVPTNFILFKLEMPLFLLLLLFLALGFAAGMITAFVLKSRTEESKYKE